MSLSTLPDTIQQLESFWPSVFTFDQFKFHDKILGEGRTGKVVLADYLGVPVACKMRRPNQPRSEFVKRLQRELRFAAELAVCRSVNPYLGVVAFKRSEFFQTRTGRDPNDVEYFGVQRYYEQGDLLAYTNNRDFPMQISEVLRIGIGIFSSLEDAHRLKIGIVDVKRENVLIDNTGSAMLTDFGSCVRMRGAEKISLSENHAEDDGYTIRWTRDVAAPEMIASNEFWLASDVFMGTLILAELMASHLTFSEFNTKVLRRHGRKGTVCFDPKEIPTRFSSFYKVLECGLENNPSDRGTATDILNMLNRIGFPMPDIYPHTFYSYWPQEPYEEKLINEDYDQSNNELMIPTQKPNFNNGYTPKFVSIDSLQLSSSDEEDANVEETHLKSAKQKRHAEKDLSSRQLRLRKDHANDPTELIKRQRLLREINRPFSFGQRR